MTCTPAATAVSRGQSASFTVAFLLLAAVVLADVIGVGEYTKCTLIIIIIIIIIMIIIIIIIHQ